MVLRTEFKSVLTPLSRPLLNMILTKNSFSYLTFSLRFGCAYRLRDVTRLHAQRKPQGAPDIAQPFSCAICEDGASGTVLKSQ